jgi:succinylarginine dihydrolase
VVLTAKEIGAANPKFFLNEQMYAHLIAWVERHYREYLMPEDLADPHFLVESQTALDELSQLLHLGSIYSFQK